MKVQYVGVNCRTGTSERTRRPYQIAEVIYLIDSQNGPSEKRSDSGDLIWRYIEYGYKVRTVDLDPSCISRFEKLQPGTEIDLDLRPRPDNPSKNVVVGINA